MDYVQVLTKLLSIDTSVPPGDNYREALDYLTPLFRQVNFETRIIEIPPEHAEHRTGRVSLVCHRRDAGKPRLIFHGHIDVVPAEGWQAFSPRVEGGKIFARGAADMKGAIPALLMALETCKDRPLKYDTSVIITTDEEIGQAGQLRYLGQSLQPLTGAHFFDMDSDFKFVTVANLGALQFEIVVRGKSVHSGLSHLGENAVEKAVPFMEALMKLKETVARRKSKVRASPDTGLDFMVARLNINMVEGGLKANIVPDQCVITVDRRLIPEENLDEARKELIDALSSVPGGPPEIRWALGIPPNRPVDDPMIEDLCTVMKAVTGESGKYGAMGSGDLGAVARELGARHFGLGVIRAESNIHGIDEFVYRKDIEDLAEIIRRFLTGPYVSAGHTQ